MQIPVDLRAKQPPRKLKDKQNADGSGKINQRCWKSWKVTGQHIAEMLHCAFDRKVEKEDKHPVVDEILEVRLSVQQQEQTKNPIIDKIIGCVVPVGCNPDKQDTGQYGCNQQRSFPLDAALGAKRKTGDGQPTLPLPLRRTQTFWRAPTCRAKAARKPFFFVRLTGIAIVPLKMTS